MWRYVKNMDLNVERVESILEKNKSQSYLDPVSFFRFAIYSLAWSWVFGGIEYLLDRDVISEIINIFDFDEMFRTVCVVDLCIIRHNK